MWGFFLQISPNFSTKYYLWCKKKKRHSHRHTNTWHIFLPGWCAVHHVFILFFCGTMAEGTVGTVCTEYWLVRLTHCVCVCGAKVFWQLRIIMIGRFDFAVGTLFQFGQTFYCPCAGTTGAAVWSRVWPYSFRVLFFFLLHAARGLFWWSHNKLIVASFGRPLFSGFAVSSRRWGFEVSRDGEGNFWKVFVLKVFMGSANCRKLGES